MKVSNYVSCVESPQLKQEYFPNINRSLTYLNIKNAIETQIWGDDDEDIVKFATLYLIHARLLEANHRNVIKDSFLHLVDDFDVFSCYL